MRLSRVLLGLVGGVALAQIVTAAGLEVMHMTPAPQPPLATISPDDLRSFRDAFNASDDRPRVLVMLSPT